MPASDLRARLTALLRAYELWAFAAFVGSLFARALPRPWELAAVAACGYVLVVCLALAARRRARAEGRDVGDGSGVRLAFAFLAAVLLMTVTPLVLMGLAD